MLDPILFMKLAKEKNFIIGKDCCKKVICDAPHCKYFHAGKFPSRNQRLKRKMVPPKNSEGEIPKRPIFLANQIWISMSIEIPLTELQCFEGEVHPRKRKWIPLLSRLPPSFFWGISCALCCLLALQHRGVGRTGICHLFHFQFSPC